MRQWYLLGDLYERAGDLPRAREYFERVGKADPEAFDVAERLRGLGPVTAAATPADASAERSTRAAEGRQHGRLNVHPLRRIRRAVRRSVSSWMQERAPGPVLSWSAGESSVVVVVVGGGAEP